MRSFSYFIIFILILFGCQDSKKLKLAVSIEGSSKQKLEVDLAEYLNSIEWKVEIIKGKNAYNPESIQALLNNEIDLAIIQNDIVRIKESNSIKTVMPLYPNVSYIFYRNHLKPKSLSELLTNNSVLITSDDEPFYKNLFNYYGVNLDSIKFNLLDLSNSVESFLKQVNARKENVLCVFAAIHTPHVKKMIENGWEILSLGDIAYSNRGSSVEGFCMNYPRSEPFIVPRNFFGQKPELPIYTISMNELLVTHENVPETVIYDLVNDIYEGKHFLSQNNLLFNYITEDFDHNALNFPLHDSTIDYLERDEPTFFERYAEAFGVIFSILVVIIGGLTSLRKIRKERIDKYYRRVMNCHNIKELEKIADEAVLQLQNEKLTADESFTIFLNLVDKRRHEIENSAIIK